ncbi:hypothetical protein SAMN05414139_05007 [Burkholderia sp. D7]|nr:hypothetical protein SAMN05414139_05007 [Burkholderia sp. D7]
MNFSKTSVTFRFETRSHILHRSLICQLARTASSSPRWQNSRSTYQELQ